MRLRNLARMGALVLMACLASAVNAAPLYSENFEVDPTANWTVNKGPAAVDAAANFFFDYSTAGIPSAPNSGGTTRGMKLQANQTSGTFGGMSASPNGQSFVGPYKVMFDWWSNFNGPAPVGGSGSTMLSTYGVNTSGAVAQWPGGTQDSIWFGATGDGNSSSDWRAYSPTPAGVVRYADTTPGIYAAGAVAGSSNQSNAYYAGFGGNTAPAAQTLLFPQQTGISLVGSAAYEWHQVVIERGATHTTWTVGGTLIATVPNGDDAVNTGNNIFFGHSDINLTSSTDPNDVNLLFTLIDNIRVVPEPASASLFGLALLGLAVVRRRTA